MNVYIDERPLDSLVRDVLTIDGDLAPAVAQTEQLVRATGPGAFGSGVTVAPRTITIGLDVWPSSNLERVTVTDTVYRALSGLRVLRTEDAPDREYWVTLTNVRPDFYHRSIARYFLELTFVAVDPTRYEREPVTVALSTARATVRVGNQPSAPRIWLYGAATSVVNPVVTVRNASGDVVSTLTLAGTLTTNDALVIDCAAHWIDRYQAGVLATGTSAGNSWLVSGDFPLLSEEDTIDGSGVSVTLSSTSGTATGLMLFTRGY